MSGLENVKIAKKKNVYHCTYNGLASWLGTTNFQCQALNQHSSTRYEQQALFFKAKVVSPLSDLNQSHCFSLMHAQCSILQLQFTQDSDLIFLKDVLTLYCLSALFCFVIILNWHETVSNSVGAINEFETLVCLLRIVKNKKIGQMIQ